MVRALRQLSAAGSRRNARAAAHRMARERRDREAVDRFLSDDALRLSVQRVRRTAQRSA